MRRRRAPRAAVDTEKGVTNRRQFLGIGLGASALPLAAPSTFAASIGAAQPDRVAPVYKALYDIRFPASVAFARRAATHGLAVQAMEGDVTRFWYDDLYHRWREGPAAIAGLTGHGVLFCLERLAWDQRLRVVFRAEHRPAAGGVLHTIEAPQPLLSAAACAVAGPAWASAVADVVVQCPSQRAPLATARAVTAGGMSAAVEPLYSWLIAPVARS
jgi:hypothetical protein